MPAPIATTPAPIRTHPHHGSPLSDSLSALEAGAACTLVVSCVTVADGAGAFSVLVVVFSAVTVFVTVLLLSVAVLLLAVDTACAAFSLTVPELSADPHELTPHASAAPAASATRSRTNTISPGRRTAAGRTRRRSGCRGRSRPRAVWPRRFPRGGGG